MRNALANGAGQVGFGCPDAALAGTITELHQVAVVQPDVRNAAFGGGGHDGRCAGAQITVVNLRAYGLHRRLHIGRAIRLVVDGGHQQPVAFGQCGAGDLFVACAKHHAVDAMLRRAAGLAKAGRHVRQVEQLDHHVFKYMASPGAFVQALQEAAALAHTAVVFQQRRQQGQQPVIKAGQPVAGIVFERTEV